MVFTNDIDSFPVGFNRKIDTPDTIYVSLVVPHKCTKIAFGFFVDDEIMVFNLMIVFFKQGGNSEFVYVGHGIN